MANAVHKILSGETLQSIAASYYALGHPGGAVNDVKRAKVIGKIRAANPDTENDKLSEYDDDDDLSVGYRSYLYVPTIRDLSRVVLADDTELSTDLVTYGFLHADKLSQVTADQLVELLPLVGYAESDVRRCHAITSFFNLDGMDGFTARHFYDSDGILSLADLADQSKASLDTILSHLVSVHTRPSQLTEQRHSERWSIESKLLTRKRVGDYRREDLFPVYVDPDEAARRAAFYEDVEADASYPAEEAELGSRLGLLYRFQEGFVRGNLAVLTGRWTEAVEAYHSARRAWHCLAEAVGAETDVDDEVGINFDTSLDAAKLLLQALPAEDDDPLGAPPTRLVQGSRPARSYRLRGFRYDELSNTAKGDLRDELADKRAHQMPRLLRTALERGVLDKTRDEIVRADRRFLSGLVSGSNDSRARDFDARDKEVLRRNTGSIEMGAFYSGSDGLDLLDQAGDKLAICDVDALLDNLWNSNNASQVLTTGAAAKYPSGFLSAISPRARFLEMPPLDGDSTSRFVEVGTGFVTSFRDGMIKDRLKSTVHADLHFDASCYENPGSFAAVAAYLYAFQLPCGLGEAYSSLGRSDQAMLFGSGMTDIYNSSGTILTPTALSSAEPDSPQFRLDMLSCTTAWDPGNIGAHLVWIHNYVRWYTRLADIAYQNGDRETARTYYADVMCAIEKSHMTLLDEARIGLTGLFDAINDSHAIDRAMDSQSSFNVVYQSAGQPTRVMDERVIIHRLADEFVDRDTAYANVDQYFMWLTPPDVTAVAHDDDLVSVAHNGASYGAFARKGSLLFAANMEDESEITLYLANLYCHAKLMAIDMGLNWFGYRDAYVPPWSFEHLFALAQNMCNRALAAEERVFSLLQAYEAAQREVLKASQAMEMAGQQANLAVLRRDEQIASSELAVMQAELSQAQHELAKSQNNAGSVISVLSTIGVVTAGIIGGVMSATGVGMPIGLGILAGVAGGLGSGASATASFIQQKQYNAIADDAKDATEQTKTLASASLAVADAEVDIALLSMSQARDYVRFLEGMTLSTSGYAYLLALAREIAEATNQHAARLSWLAQRALCHETRLPFDLVRTGYASDDEILDLTRAQRLTADLEALRSTYTSAETQRRQTIKWTVPLSLFSPGTLESLRSNGKGALMVPHQVIDRAFPGLYLHSLKEVSIAFIGTLPPQGPRGVLRASGSSWVRVPNNGTYEDGSRTQDDWITTALDGSITGGDAVFDDYAGFVMKEILAMGAELSLSQFDVQADRAVLHLPQGMLPPLANLGLESLWTLELFREANGFEFDQLVDVEVTFWFLAAFDPMLARASYEALRREGLRGDLEGVSLTSAAGHLPDQWSAWVGDPTDPESLDIRRLELDVDGLPPYETARKVTNLLLAVAEEADITLRLLCDTVPEGFELTTTDGHAFTANGFSEPDNPWPTTGPQPDAQFQSWVASKLYSGGSPATDPVQRWVIKVSPATVGSAWRAEDADGVAVTTTSGPLVGTAGASASGTATYDEGGSWANYAVRVKVATHGSTVRIRAYDDGTDHYALQIAGGAVDQVRLFRVENGTDTELGTSLSIDYPDDEYLVVELAVFDHPVDGTTLRATVDGIQLLSRTDINPLAAGTVGLEVVTTGGNGARFDDVEVVQLTRQGEEAETLHVEPFTSSLPDDWTFVDGTTAWQIGSTGHNLLDLSSLVDVTFKVDYQHQMVDPA